MVPGVTLRPRGLPEASDQSASEAATYEIVVAASIREVGEASYRALVRPDTPPFLHFEWLDALEQTGCVVPEKGWLPQFLSVYRKTGPERRLVAVVPAYVKWHSDGEFVFDHAWAHFAERRLGLDYYPKLILAVPFTPATGARVLVDPTEDPRRAHQALSEGIQRLLGYVPLSSAHLLFPDEPEAESFGSLGWARRYGVQYHWENPGYRTYDDFLARFTAKRRAALRRERRMLEEAGVELEVRTASDLTEPMIAAAYEFYLSTVDKYVWGRRYLNRDFFFTVAESMPDRLHLVLARERGSHRWVGGAFNLLGQDALYGRYWGAVAERPFLHFNVCYYAGIEDCIRRGLRRFEPGAGGEHKHARGFEATITHSAHWLRNEALDGAVRHFLSQERSAVMAAVQRDREHSVLRPF